MNTDVLVVGAGPVGLTMAAELARYGVRVRILERAASATDKSKALVVWSRTLELLDRAGCSGAFVAAGHRVDAAQIIGGSKQIGRVAFGAVDTPYPYALMLPQSETERLLGAHLQALGIRVERGAELTGFSDGGSSVQATVRHGDGREEAMEASWLIGCDGAHSTVRHTLGLAFRGATMPSDWILADIHISGLQSPDSELVMHWHPEGVLAIFPISPGRYRIIADIRADVAASEVGPPESPTLEAVQSIVDQRGPGGLRVSDPIWLSGFRINERKVGDYRSGRAFVAGDAAHVHSPAGGQGMNTGMQDAFNLAWKLALVCRGTCGPDRLLDSYSTERSAVGAQVLSNAGRMTTLALMKSHTAQTVRNLLGGFLFGLAPVQRAMADALTEVSIGYAHSPLNGPGAHGLARPAPGERVAPRPGELPVGAGDTPRFALFAAAGHAADRVLREHRDLLEPALRPPLVDGGIWLVRPDGYAAAVAREPDTRLIADYLDAFRQLPVRELSA
jgi:2-polyprenyl-6-methoxyphenol hydroxylase-like FAD-dependent oxidoreductase